MGMNQREIYLADLGPTKGQEQSGVRPVVLISGNIMNKYLKLLIVCPISSKIKNYPSCVILKKNKINNLTSDSEVLTFQVRAVSPRRLIKKIGEISEVEWGKVVVGLNDVLKY